LRHALCILLAAATGGRKLGIFDWKSAGSIADWIVYSVKWIILSSSVMALSISTRRISRIGTDFLRYWL